MATFDVFVEAPTATTSDAVERLADIMSQRYGLPNAELRARMANGRVRVKSNVDEATANTYARDLETIGARVSIAENRGSAPSIARSSPSRGVRLSLPPTSALPPATTSQRIASALPPRAGTSSLPPATLRAGAATNPPFTSGLAAAFSGEIPIAGLGALDQAEALSLASLDDDGSVQAKVSFSGAPAKPNRPKDVPLDLFAPPSTGDAEVQLAPDDVVIDVASDVAEGAPPGRGHGSPRSPVLQRGTRSSIAPVAIVAPEPVLPRMRFGAGVLLAVVVGFVPAHLVAAYREDSAYAAIDAHVDEVQARANARDPIVPYAGLDEFRVTQHDRKQTERRNIALGSLAIWAAVASLFAYVWFKRIPWDRG